MMTLTREMRGWWKSSQGRQMTLLLILLLFATSVLQLTLLSFSVAFKHATKLPAPTTYGDDWRTEITGTSASPSYDGIARANRRQSTKEQELGFPKSDIWPSSDIENPNEFLLNGNDAAAAIVEKGPYMSKEKPIVDFLVAGFPKCGTTSLLYAFRRHNETIMPEKETCSINSGTRRGMKRMQQALDNAADTGSSNAKRGIKCPLSVWNTLGIQQLVHHAPDMKLIIGIRHPVSFFQSYYNYRVTSMHDKGEVVKAPPPESLIGVEHQWKDVSTDIARFELGLMQLAKVKLSKQQLKHLESKGRKMTFPVPFKIFVYSIEQLEDANEERASIFRKDMQQFLGLGEPLSFTRENVNHFVGVRKHPETIDICESRFDSLRTMMVIQGNATQKWIKEKFIMSDDVMIGGSKQHFDELLSSFAMDPCISATA